MAVTALDDRRWTRKEYERLVREGAFPPGARIELVDGILYEMSPQDSPHATGFRLAQVALGNAFPLSAGYEIRGQLPLALGEDSEPEPDIAVVPGSIRDYSHHHPATALLVVEVADSSLLHDRKRKIPLYARSGIPESWLLNLPRRTLEVYRNPTDGVYRRRIVLRAGDSVSPVTRPGVSIAVADLLP
jgi:Uma2 family endonuclease